MSTLNFSLVAAVTLFDPTRGPVGDLGRPWVIACIVADVVVAVVWFVSDVMTRGVAARASGIDAVCLSIGLASLSIRAPREMDASTAWHLLAAADEAMYRAKARGGARVESVNLVDTPPCLGSHPSPRTRTTVRPVSFPALI
ncbi:hypothetical protein [Gordonia oryzae]|uniref:hypothetical protein n=1 Tax=Gordonia oryzae TaxID=2487349 RepID=UPI001FE71DC2|nr:hypothetical protein [Gordonia oryzae]